MWDRCVPGSNGGLTERVNMTQQAWTHDVAVVGGAGHIGAPLAILMATKGMRTLIYDINQRAMDQIAAGSLPFHEEGGQALLDQALAMGTLEFTASPAKLRGCANVVITIGTPIDEFHNPLLSVITNCMKALLPHLCDEQLLILRSTVFPGVTDYLHRFLGENGKRPGLAFCPERVVQGLGFKEIQTLPQIVSGTTPAAQEAAARLFGRLAPTIVRMVPAEAEFAKLICNAYRYIQFAAANQFFIMAEAAGLNYFRILEGVKRDYPRAAGLPGAGFAAGPCLMKDTMQLFAFSNNNFMLGQVAMTVNEGLPNWVVEKIRSGRDLTQTRVGILGMAFKADCDDPRESLSYKLGKILRFRGAKVSYSDEFVSDPTFVSKEELVATCDVVIIGVPHTAYKSLEMPPGVELIDIWNAIPVRQAPSYRLAA